MVRNQNSVPVLIVYHDKNGQKHLERVSPPLAELLIEKGLATRAVRK